MFKNKRPHKRKAYVNKQRKKMYINKVKQEEIVTQSDALDV